MTDSEGWTFVKSRRRAPQRLPNKSTQPSLPQPRAECKSVEAIRKDHERYAIQWTSSPARRALDKILSSSPGCSISNVVCLGIGTFSSDNFDALRKTHIQLLALQTIISQLACVFQEPLFSKTDKAFLTSQGYSVVDAPAANAHISSDTLLFAIHLYRPVYADALADKLPGVFIGTGWDVWDGLMTAQKEGLDGIKTMSEDYSVFAFPEEGTVFSGTSIYWRPKTNAEAAQDDDDDDNTGKADKEASSKN